MELLLKSIQSQHLDDGIEIIIVNDRSTETDFLNVIKEYDSLDIKVVNVSNEENFIHCPGNTREVGASLVTGEWITFVDHDDEFIPDTFKQIKEIIIYDTGQLICFNDGINSIIMNTNGELQYYYPSSTGSTARRDVGICYISAT